jgi:hypothetical protein
MLGRRSKGVTLALVMIKQASIGENGLKTEKFTTLASQASTTLSTAAVGAITTLTPAVTDHSKFIGTG